MRRKKTGIGFPEATAVALEQLMFRPRIAPGHTKVDPPIFRAGLMELRRSGALTRAERGRAEAGENVVYVDFEGLTRREPAPTGSRADQAARRTPTLEPMMDSDTPWRLHPGRGHDSTGQPGTRPRTELDPGALADLLTAPSEAVAERARKALWPVLPHSGLVVVTPGPPVFTVQIAAADEVRPRLSAIDWTELVGPQLPADNGVIRLELPDAFVELQAAGWVARTADFVAALIVTEARRSAPTPAREHAAMLTAMCVAVRRRVVDTAPRPPSPAFSRARTQEQEPIRLELRSRHSATPPSLSHALRAASAAGRGSGTLPGVDLAIDMASRARPHSRHDAVLNAGSVSPRRRVVTITPTEREPTMRKILTVLVGGALAVLFAAAPAHASVPMHVLDHCHHGVVGAILDWLL